MSEAQDFHTVVVTLNGQRFTWNGSNWFGEDYLEPPTAIVGRLNTLAAERFNAEDSKLSDFQALLDAAKFMADAGQYSRALVLARRAFDLKPHSHGAAAVLMSVLRRAGKPNAALEVADPFVRNGTEYTPLLTSRAAALCDLNRWEEALRQIRQVFALGGGQGSGESLMVWSRIKASAPSLVDR